MADIRQKAVATANAYDQGDIASLDAAMTRRLIASTVLTESHGGDLGVTNRQGYVGRYQAGAGWLADAGYVDADKLKEAMAGYKTEWAWARSGGMTQFLENSANWNHGLSLERYKADGDLQDRAFKINCDKSYRQAIADNVLKEDDSPEKVAGFLKARHISGYGGAKEAVTGGRVYRDSNGTSNYDYLHDITRNRDGLNQYMSRGAQTQDNDAPAPRQSANTAPMADGVLRQGERGAEVTALQQKLIELGVRDREGRALQADGVYSPATKQAVESFQREHGLSVDGVAGPRTLGRVDQAISEQRNLAFGDRLPQEVLDMMAARDAEHIARNPVLAEALKKLEAIRHEGSHIHPEAGLPGLGHAPSEKSPLITDPNHPDNKLYKQAYSNLQQFGENGGFKSQEELQKAAAALAADAKASGLTQIDHVTRSTNGQGLIAVQGEDPWANSAKRAYLDQGQATTQSVEQSTRMADQSQPLSASQNNTQPQNEVDRKGPSVLT